MTALGKILFSIFFLFQAGSLATHPTEPDKCPEQLKQEAYDPTSRGAPFHLLPLPLPEEIEIRGKKYPHPTRLPYFEDHTERFLVNDKTLNRKVVLKLFGKIKEPLTEPESVEMGLERAALELFDHPNVVRVFELGVTQWGRPYLILDFIDGENVQDLLRRGRLPLQQKLFIIRKMADALSELHRAGILHYAMRPSSIVVDRRDNPWLVDFGLARSLRHKIDSATLASSTGGVSYLSPEQASGEGHLDVRNDVFSLGAVLYHLLTGNAPYQEATAEEALQKAQQGEFDLKALEQRGIPGEIRRICLKAMEKNREDRYPTADAFGQALDAFQAGEGRKGPSWAILSAVVFSTALGSALWMAWPEGKPDQPPLEPNSLHNILAREEWVRSEMQASVLRLNRKDPEIFDLTRQVPLKPGDRVRVRALVPNSLKVAVFWWDGRGKIAPIEHQRLATQDDPMAEIAAPKGNRWVMIGEEGGAAGLLILGSLDREPPLDLVRGILAPFPHRPEPPARSVVYLHMDRVSLLDQQKREGIMDPKMAPKWKRQGQSVGKALQRHIPYVMGLFFWQSSGGGAGK